ncbi:hypothetical protein NMS_1571 [Nonlabens marinus S1-08]|uniref:Uncharacterized protein n=1 Tax=Nonlabens marinus S1-08 TaxID=1454201 RepID=W8VRC7_9FLAO|nr:hypothetical protein NMS_1571 [Nonlabens marinus S1-08]
MCRYSAFAKAEPTTKYSNQFKILLGIKCSCNPYLSSNNSQFKKS